MSSNIMVICLFAAALTLSGCTQTEKGAVIGAGAGGATGAAVGAGVAGPVGAGIGAGVGR